MRIGLEFARYFILRKKKILWKTRVIISPCSLYPSGNKNIQKRRDSCKCQTKVYVLVKKSKLLHMTFGRVSKWRTDGQSVHKKLSILKNVLKYNRGVFFFFEDSSPDALYLIDLIRLRNWFSYLNIQSASRCIQNWINDLSK